MSRLFCRLLGDEMAATKISFITVLDVIMFVFPKGACALVSIKLFFLYPKKLKANYNCHSCV